MALSQKQIKFLFANGILSKSIKGKTIYNIKLAKQLAQERSIARFGSEGTGLMHRTFAEQHFTKGTQIHIKSEKGKQTFIVTGMGTSGLTKSARERGVVRPKIKQVSGTPAKVTHLGDIGFNVQTAKIFNKSMQVRIRKPT